MNSNDSSFEKELDESFDRALGVYLEELSAPEPSGRFTQHVMASVKADSELRSVSRISNSRGRSSRVRVSRVALAGAAAVLVLGLAVTWRVYENAPRSQAGSIRSDAQTFAASIFQELVALAKVLGSVDPGSAQETKTLLTKSEVLVDSSTIRKKSLIEEEIDSELAAPTRDQGGSVFEFFRRLLLADASERSALLASRPADERERILAKVAEYERLDADQRLARLWRTEYHFYFHQLVSRPMSDRMGAIHRLDEPMKSQLQRGFAIWDDLNVQRREALLLEGRAASFLIARLTERVPNDDRSENVKNSPPSDQQALARRYMLTSLSGVSAHLLRDFDDLADKCEVFDAAQRRELRDLLEMFHELPTRNRVESFQTILGLAEASDGEWRAFVNEALNWRQISPAERAKWRSIADNLPPLPWEVAVELGGEFRPTVLPPEPPGFHRREGATRFERTRSLDIN